MPFFMPAQGFYASDAFPALLTPLKPAGPLARSRDGLNHQFYERFNYYTAKGLPLSVPAGATSDGRSSPRATWAIVPPSGQGWLAYVLHDAAYRGVLEIFCVDGVYRPLMFTKQQSDDLLEEVMRFLGCSDADVLVTFDAVAKFGQASFDEDRAKLAAFQQAAGEGPVVTIGQSVG